MATTEGVDRLRLTSTKRCSIAGRKRSSCYAWPSQAGRPCRFRVSLRRDRCQRWTTMGRAKSSGNEWETGNSGIPSILIWHEYARVAELADAPDLGSGGETRGGSSPPFRTNSANPLRQGAAAQRRSPHRAICAFVFIRQLARTSLRSEQTRLHSKLDSFLQALSH